MTELTQELNSPAHPHEAVHLPAPSFMPLLLGLGFFVFAFGLVLKGGRIQSLVSLSPYWYVVAGVGLVLLFTAIGGWVWSNIVERTRAPLAFQGNAKMAMWVFLGNEILFFTGLIASFLLLRAKSDLGVDHALIDSIPLVSLNTFVLLTSSLTVVLAHDAAVNNRQGRLKLMLFLSILLGATFVSLQGVEYTTLYRENLTWTASGFGTAFFTLTGTHGLHVIIGIIWCTIIFVRSLFGGFKDGQYGGVELFGLYWHFVDVVWILLFTLVYLMHTHVPAAAAPAGMVLKFFGL